MNFPLIPPQRRIARALLYGSVLLSASRLASASVPFVTITGTGSSPLTKIHCGDEMSFQCFHRTVPGLGQIYPSTNEPGDMGIFARVGTTLYSPDFASHGGTATGGIGAHTAWTPVSTSVLSGNGTAATPFNYTIVADAGTSGLRLMTTVTYRNDQNFFRHNMRFQNTGSVPLTFDAFVASDIYLAGSDSGVPLKISGTNSVGGNDCPPGGTYTILHIPVTPADNYTARGYGTVWSEIGSGHLDNLVNTGCQDNGAGLEWQGRTLQPGQSITILAATSFGEVPSIANEFTGVNKDLLNGTGSMANQLSLTVTGVYTNVISHFDGGFTSFAVSNNGTFTTFTWSGMNVPNGVVKHVGFQVYGPEIKFFGITWKLNGVTVGCARQVNTLYGTHSSGTHHIVYENSCLDCAATTLYVGELSAEHYAVPPPLADWNPTTIRNPFQVDVITQPPMGIPPNGTFEMQVPPPPAGANYTLLVFKVCTNPSMTGGELTHDFLLVPNDIASSTVDTPTSPFCVGDGTSTPCPCGNTGAAGHGCANALFPGGALLSSSGIASDESISGPGADTLVLTATGIPGPAMFIQSNGLAGPLPFGDGLLCAAVGIVRLGVVFPSGGVASFPGGLTPAPIHVRGSAFAGQTRHYQAWYRSVQTLCGQNFNLTQGLSLVWGS